MGCGWLGKPLALALLDKGYFVKGTTTQIKKLDDLRKSGIDPYIVELNETYIDGGIDAFLENIDTLVINIPPRLRTNPDSDYAGRVRLLMRSIDIYSRINRVIYISSTAVFKDTPQIPIYTEKNPANATDKKGLQLIAGEEVIRTAQASTVIIRPGGLIGGHRHPIKYLAGKKDLDNATAPVNLTDRTHLINIIIKSITGQVTVPTIHAISEAHDTRQSYYIKKAQEQNLEPPVFNDQPSVGKKVTSVIL